MTVPSNELFVAVVAVTSSVLSAVVAVGASVVAVGVVAQAVAKISSSVTTSVRLLVDMRERDLP